jgi:hypothetical protein
MSEQTFPFSCKIATSDPTCALSLEILLDDERIYYNPHVSETVEFSHEINDTELKKDRELKFVMSGKKPEHTQILDSESGTIIKDVLLSVTEITMDDIDIGLIVDAKSVYSHNFNGTGRDTQESFFGEMGCNGTVSFAFSTPIYLWLLENM